MEMTDLVKAAGDFIKKESACSSVYIYDTDLDDAGISHALSSNRVVKVTFEYADAPTIEEMVRNA